MKNKFLLFTLLSFFAICTSTQAQTAVIRYPFGAVTTLTPTYVKPLPVIITNTVTYLKPGALTDSLKLSVTVSADIKTGAILYLETTASAADRKVVFGTGFTCPVTQTDSGKTFMQQFIYDGTVFKPLGVAYKIN